MGRPVEDLGARFERQVDRTGEHHLWLGGVNPERGTGRREEASAAGRTQLSFDGSILGLRKFTSSELFDAGFNISVVAERQGHGAQVLTRH